MAPISDVPVTVCSDIDVASVLLQRGAQVVLCCPDATALGAAINDLRTTAAAPGARMAALVGDLADPDMEATAFTMARELFGGEPEVVPTVSGPVS